VAAELGNRPMGNSSTELRNTEVYREQSGCCVV